VRTGGQILVDQLELHGVEHAFCVPGESYLAVLDALHDTDITLISCRHEAAAANMAEAYGKLTGRPGICLVTRGPGATHASVGVHIASQDSTPMILLVGQAPRPFLGRDAFQELDYPHAFGGLGLAKWVAQAESPERLPEPSPEWSVGSGDSAGSARSEGSGRRVGCGELLRFSCWLGVAFVTPRCSCGVALGVVVVGLGWITVTTCSVHTTGLGLPVAA